MIRSNSVIRHHSDTPFKDFIESYPDSRGTGEYQCLFSRISGCETTIQAHLNAIRKKANMTPANYVLIADSLDMNFDPSDTARAKKLYDEMMLEVRQECPVGCPLWLRARHAIASALDFYTRHYPSDTTSMLTNLGVKQILWLQRYLPAVLDQHRPTSNLPKVLYTGKLKKHEACFLHALWLLGCDVLCVHPSEDPLSSVEAYQSLSNAVWIQKEHKILPELSYEDLAKLSDAVVMIRVFDEEGQLVSGGSGVVINNSGYIITNFHVVVGGSRFGVVFENDPVEYESHQIIKYHQDFDVALIRVQRPVKHLVLSEGQTVRGQRVVAIGSPLGLFNTISDGIVSGYRNFEDVDMIQFTAPISSGSSGGALLNLKGELLGITTAGYNGQNLNLAVPSSYLKFFAGNFI